MKIGHPRGSAEALGVRLGRWISDNRRGKSTDSLPAFLAGVGQQGVSAGVGLG